jgi:hypothetical protein
MTQFIGNGETGRALPKPRDPNIVYSLSSGASDGTLVVSQTRSVGVSPRASQTKEEATWIP